MELRTKRSSHPGYHYTGGSPRARAVPGAKTKKDLATEEKERKAKAKADGLKKITMIKRANTTAYTNDKTPRPAQTSSCGHKQSKAQEPSSHQMVSPSEPASEFTPAGSDTEN